MSGVKVLCLSEQFKTGIGPTIQDSPKKRPKLAQETLTHVHVAGYACHILQVAEAGGNSVRVWVHVEGDSRWIIEKQ